MTSRINVQARARLLIVACVQLGRLALAGGRGRGLVVVACRGERRQERGGHSERMRGVESEPAGAWERQPRPAVRRRPSRHWAARFGPRQLQERQPGGRRRRRLKCEENARECAALAGQPEGAAARLFRVPLDRVVV